MVATNSFLAAGNWICKCCPLFHTLVLACDDLESFPEETLLPSTVTTLVFQDLQNLKSLDSKGLKHLISLTEFTIRNCPKLQSIPEEGLPSSLSHLSIYNCPLLEKKCGREIGEDWPKISHIDNVWINFPSFAWVSFLGIEVFYRVPFQLSIFNHI